MNFRPRKLPASCEMSVLKSTTGSSGSKQEVVVAFLLYRIDRSARFYRLVQELNASNGCSLWGNGGAVGRCARGQVLREEGP